jgi:hypothetical protein
VLPRNRKFSTKPEGGEKPPVDGYGQANSVSTEVLTPGEKVVASGYLVSFYISQ